MMIDSVIWWMLSGIITILLIMAGWLLKKQISSILSELRRMNNMLTKIMTRQARDDEKFNNIEKELFEHEKAIGILSHDHNKLNQEFQKLKIEIAK